MNQLGAHKLAVPRWSLFPFLIIPIHCLPESGYSRFNRQAKIVSCCLGSQALFVCPWTLPMKRHIKGMGIGISVVMLASVPQTCLLRTSTSTPSLMHWRQFDFAVRHVLPIDPSPSILWIVFNGLKGLLLFYVSEMNWFQSRNLYKIK